jgi:hypothetical protein
MDKHIEMVVVVISFKTYDLRDIASSLLSSD